MRVCVLTAVLVLSSIGMQNRGAVGDRQFAQVRGHIVRFDPFLPPGPPYIANFILKTEGDRTSFLRLFYAPGGFGFDAPSPRSDQVLPERMFTDGRIVWSFGVRTPRNEEEQAACKARHVLLSRDPETPGPPVVEKEVYRAVPGWEGEKIPQTRTLDCLIVDTWKEDGPKPTSGIKLVGRIVLCDWVQHEMTSTNDFVVNVASASGKNPARYARVIYKPFWGGWDAPPPSPIDILDRWAFVGMGPAWVFLVHAPQTAEQKEACAAPVRNHKYRGGDGKRGCTALRSDTRSWFCGDPASAVTTLLHT